jgi:hypothetical protein
MLKNPTKPNLQPIARQLSQRSVMTVDEAVESDRRYFDEHPDDDEYIREFVPGEFGKAELPEIPPGFRYATHVSVLMRNGQQVGRYRKLMTVCDGNELRRQGYMK